jgi:hypothetical protein
MLSRALDLVLAALALLGPFAIHLFFPVIPVIKVDFQLTDALCAARVQHRRIWNGLFDPRLRCVRGRYDAAGIADRPLALSSWVA